MKSKWFELKDVAISLRKDGFSIKAIEKHLKIPRSTLSGWLKNIDLTDEHKNKLIQKQQDGLKSAQLKANEWHRAQKALRILAAKQDAFETLQKIDITKEILDLAFAMLYFGEGTKSGVTSISSSSPTILKFVLRVLELNYSISKEMVKCDLHLRADQDPEKLKDYWSSILGVPSSRIRGIYVDQRSIGKPTYPHYMGVCVLYCGPVAIQRKLIYLYNLFCEKVDAINGGG